MAVKADITIDIDKQVGNLQNLTNIYNARVGDNKTPLTVLWRKNGMALNLKGLHAFIAGKVGDGSYNAETDKVDFPVGTPVVKYEDDGSGTLDNGQSGLTTLLIPKQMWAKTGLFAGYIGLKDENGSVFTSKDIFFKVLGNVLDAGVAINYFIDDFSKVIQNSKLKLQENIDDARNTYESETKNAHDSLDALKAQIQANRDEQQNLSQHLAGTEQQIAIHDIVTKLQHDTDIKNISDAINKRLSAMKMAPTGVDDYNSLIEKYPNGTDGVFLTQDTKHIYTYLNGSWQDLGAYEAIQLDKNTIESLYDTKGKSLGAELITNGSFGTNSVEPAYPATTSTQLFIQNYLNRNWLTIHSDSTDQWKGVKWNIDKQNGEIFKYPLTVSFDAQSAEDLVLAINLAYYDAQGNQLDVQSIDDNAVLKQWRFTHYEKSFMPDNRYTNCASIVLQIITNDNKPIQKIMLTSVSLHIDLDTKENRLIPNGDFTNGSIVPAYPATTSTQLFIQNYLNRNWLTIHSDSTDQWKGVKWNIDKQNGEIFKYPLTVSFDAQSAEDLVLAINLAYYDAQGNQLDVQSIDDNAVLKQSRFTHYENSFMPDNQYTNCASIVLQIITNDNKPIQKIMLTSVSLRVNFDTENQDQKNLHGNFTNGSIVPAYPATDSTQLSIQNYLNRNWLTIHSDSTDQWKGVKWNIDKQNGEIFKYPLTVSFDAQSAEDLVLAINFVYYDAQGNQLDVQSIDDNAVLKQWRFTHYENSFMPDNQYTNCASIALQIITNDNKPIQKIMLTSVSLWVNFDTENQDQKNLQALEEKHHLPVMMLKGDLTGISGENYVKVTWFYTNKGSNLSGYGTVKWQGDSSQAYPKKAYRLKTLKADYKSKDKIKFLPSWKKHNKYNLKAYYTDGLISRDPVNANIGGAIWSDQKDLPKDLITEDNFGFIDGFPIILYINDKFAGVYSLNLPRSDFDYTKFAIIGSQYNDLTQFKTDKPNVKLDGSDFESLHPDDQPTEDEKKAVDSLISFVANTSDDDFKKHLTEHIDLASAIDYFIFSNIVSNTDAWGKNQVILSWDGKIWYWHPYDLDVSYSAQYDGSLIPMPNSILGTPHRLFDRLNKLYQTEIRTRYTLIRSWLTPSYVLDKYKARINTIGLANFKAEHDKWNNPAKDTEDFKQLTDAVYHQFQLLDKNWLITAQVQPTSGTTPANTEPTKQETDETSSKPTETQAQPTEPKQ